MERKKIRIQDLADLHERCAGIDVHKESLSVCLIEPGASGRPEGEIQQFGTTTRELRRLSQWLGEHKVTHVVMESTGVYWQPVWQILETGGFQLLLANAQAVRNVPGKKTDTADCVWLATLLGKGLIEASFIPPAEVRALRDLCRSRKSLVQDRTRVVERIQKLLEQANIKLDSVVTDVMGVSGRQMLEAIKAGEKDPEVLAEHALGRMRAKIPQLVPALEGYFRPHQIFLLRQWLQHYDHLSGQIKAIEQEIETFVAPFEPAITRLIAMPGLDRISAAGLVGEFGPDLKAFPTPQRFCSWATVCSGNRESGGKRRSGRTRQGNRWLKGMLSQCAWAATHDKDSYYRAQYRRLAPRLGKKRALIAVAHSMLNAIWYILYNELDFQDLGADYFDKLNVEAQKRACVKKLERLGFKVSLQLAA